MLTEERNESTRSDAPRSTSGAGDPVPNHTLTTSPEHIRRQSCLWGGEQPSLAEQQLFGRYRVERQLGAGGMGAVYLARDTVLDRLVALKIALLPDAMTAARFLQEARAAAALQHPNICPIYDCGEVDGIHYLCIPFVHGEVLRNRTAPDRLLPPAEVARIVRAVALAMQTAHDVGVIHRDLKPSNLMLDGRGEPVVVDFGLARRATDSGLTLHGCPMGTPAYMPPEQIAGDYSRVGPLSDVYSLGVVLFELLTGEHPFVGDLYELMAQIQSTPADRPSVRRPGLDPRFDQIVLTALAKTPEHRWASMRAFADALEGLTDSPTSPSIPPPTPSPDLVLRVVGTTFAYRPPPGWEVLKVGRQRRRAGQADSGNDLVVRVAGEEALSARISRHHFEIFRTTTGFTLVDRSKAGLTRNGEPVPKGCPVPIADGDLLGMAGVVILKVAVDGLEPVPGVLPVSSVQIPASAATGGRLEIEASLGDVVTVDT